MVLAIFFFRLGGNYYIKIVDWLTYITPLISVFFGYTTFKYFGKESKQGKIYFDSDLCNLFVLLLQK